MSWASWASMTSPSNAPSSLSRVDAVERKPCAQSSPPGAIAAHVPQRLVQRVVGHWHAIFVGRPADRGSASRDRRFRRRALRAHDKDPPLTPQYHVRSIPPGFRVRAGFDSGRGDCGDRNGMGRANAGEPAILFLPANSARRLVGISVGIGSSRRQKMFQIQLVMILGDCRPGAPSFRCPPWL